MSTLWRARELASDACVLCGVPAGTVCRSPLAPHTPYPSLLHDVPVSITDTERLSILEDQARYASSTTAQAQRVVKQSQRRVATNTSPFTLMEEQLPTVNGSALKVFSSVSAVLPGNPPTQWRTWEQTALMVRSGGNWTALGGVFDLPVSPASAGSGSWASVLSLPGSDLGRLTVTGQANVVFVGSITFIPY